MTSLKETLGALEAKAKGSLSKQTSDCLRLLEAARDLLPGSATVEPTVILYSSIPLQAIPRDLWPEDMEPGEWGLGDSREDSLEQSSTEGSQEDPLVPIPKAVEANQGDLDPETEAALAAIARDLAVYLEEPLVSWKDLKAALRDTVKELSGLAFPEAVPPMLLGSVLPGDPEGFYRRG